MQVNTKFNVGDTVYAVGKALNITNKELVYVMCETKIKAIYQADNLYYIVDDDFNGKQSEVAIVEQYCFADKDEAIKAVDALKTMFADEIDQSIVIHKKSMLESFEKIKNESIEKMQDPQAFAAKQKQDDRNVQK